MIDSIQPLLQLLVEQAPNLVFAGIAIYYLAKQNARALEAMTSQSDKQFALLEKLCARCKDDSAST